MKTIYNAIALGLITSVQVTKRGVVVFSEKKPNGVFYTSEDFEKTILPKLSSKCKQVKEATAGTLEPQA